MAKIDWEGIELDYKMGVPVTTVSRTYGVPEGEINAMALAEDWGVNDSLSGYMVMYRHKMFVEHYLQSFDRIDAMRKAGYTGKSFPNLLKKPEVRALLEMRMKELVKNTEVTRDRVIREYAILAFYDATEVFGNDGRPLPLKELPKELRKAIVGMKVTDEFEGKGDKREHIGTVKEYKLADKQKALDGLAKYLGMFKEEVTVKAEVEVKDAPLTENDAARRIAFLFAQAMQKSNQKENQP